ncbi:MAG: potassium channel protein [Ardenticatenales bacterium]|nr:potassium channel protein [Ardenticatenales bacterium]
MEHHTAQLERVSHRALSQLYRSRLYYAFLMIVFIMALGTLGYHLLEGWSLLDSLYMTVITLGTVGYGEVHPLTTSGRIFTMMLIILSIAIAGYSVSTLAAFVLEGEFNRLLQLRRMDKHISSLQDHIVLCGGGHTGRHVAHEFYQTRTPFVVIEQDPVALNDLLRVGDVPYIEGDATDDETLLLAGIQRAKGLVTTLGEDKDNVFVVLSARAFNPRLRIVTRLVEEKNAEKLRKAGADEIVFADALGGMRMASVMIRPSVVTFLDEMLRVREQTLRVEQIEITEHSAIVNKTLGDADIGRRTGMLVVAIRAPSGNYLFNPGAQTVLEPGDILIVIGTPEQMAQVEHKRGVL